MILCSYYDEYWDAISLGFKIWKRTEMILGIKQQTIIVLVSGMPHFRIDVLRADFNHYFR